ncbi:MAG: transposase [Planctomycetes bacterium]|nr:transposase [Planctomycetota bacterium]
MVTDGNGTPLTVEVTAGQVHESTQVESVMNGIAIPQRLGRPRSRPKKLAADKGYSVPRVRDWLRARGIKPIIPHKSNERAWHDGRVKFDRRAYRQRGVVSLGRRRALTVQAAPPVLPSVHSNGFRASVNGRCCETLIKRAAAIAFVSRLLPP